MKDAIMAALNSDTEEMKMSNIALNGDHTNVQLYNNATL
jgi:hypothetical protein